MAVAKTKIAREDELREGQTLKFPFTRAGKPSEGFLARFHGKLVAYENQCRHLPLRLDFDTGKFFTGEGEHFICQTHNAIYDPLTGLCVRGPCEGQSLKPLKIEVTNGDVWLLS
jgi:nitrite reductase/ring-hydroxylating ferredoxin subunit